MAKRNSKGQYVKTGRKSSSRRSTSRALVPVRSGAITIRESVSVSRPKRHGGGKRRASAHHGGRMPLKVKGELAGWGSVLGYIETQKADTYNKIPALGGLPREAIIGIGLHLVGKKHKHVDRAAAAALTIAGYKVGAAGYKLSGDDGED